MDTNMPVLMACEASRSQCAAVMIHVLYSAKTKHRQNCFSVGIIGPKIDSFGQSSPCPLCFGVHRPGWFRENSAQVMSRDVV